MKKVIMCAVLAVLFLTGCQKNYIREGTGYLEKQQYGEAEKSFKQAAEKKQDAAEAYRGLGMAYYEQKDYKNAQKAFQKVLDNKGEVNPVLYNLLGVCSLQMDDPEKALSAFKDGLALEGDKKGSADKQYAAVVQEMKYNEIVCYEKLHDWDKAKTKALEYIKQYPDDEDAKKEARFLSTR